jgi:BirA family biotin operon repressor/biotin-[acetyl-CoA-carboxylase] ligase
VSNSPEIQRFDEIDSTNAEALRQLKQQPKDWLNTPRVFIARSQTAGRGRRGRAWTSKPDAGLYFSLLRRFSLEPDQLQGLSLVVGLSVRAAIESLGAMPIRLKWPNDIQFEGRKLGGILLELRQSAMGSDVVIGIGVNLDLPASDAAQLARPIADLRQILGGPADPNRLSAAMIERLGSDIELFEREGFSAFIARWNDADEFMNHCVCLERGDEKIVGVSRGVDANGALLLEVEEQPGHTQLGEEAAASVGIDSASKSKQLLRFEGGELSASLRSMESAR